LAGAAAAVTAAGVDVAALGEGVGEQQSLVVQAFQDRDSGRDRFGDDPGVGPGLPFGPFRAGGVADAFPALAVQEQQPAGAIAFQAAAFEGEDYWWSARIPTVRYSFVGELCMLWARTIVRAYRG
jgi:hypothetical protein